MARSHRQGETRPVTTGRGAVRAFKEHIGPASDRFEREADLVAGVVVRDRPAPAGGLEWSAAAAPEGTIQRAPGETEPAAAEPGEVALEAAPEAAREASQIAPPEGEPQDETQAQAAGQTLLVEDDNDAARGQMRRSEFLRALRADVCAAVDTALSSTGRDSQGCPYVDYWFGYYEDRSASQIERSLWRYAPEAAAATDASEYVRLVTTRVLRSAQVWARTGELSGVPDEVPPNAMPGGKAAESFGGMFFKSQPGGARHASPISVRDRLGAGQPLPGALRSRMESAFVTSFAGVRLHVDEAAAQLSTDLRARAFTVGRHVAFAPGEFRPGTVVGDALIAHELAHVVQQGHADSERRRMPAGDAHGERRLEDDADFSAARAVSSLWGKAQHASERAIPRLTSGLSLQRCSTESEGPIGQTRATQARANFRKENKGLGAAKLDKIDAALALATKGNLDLLITFYDYYSNHTISEELPEKSNLLGETKPGSDTKLRKGMLAPGFSTSTLGSTLIHEFVHTRHETNVMGSRDYQEGEAYGVEYVIAKRAGDTARMQVIESVMGNPTQLAMPALVPALIEHFKIAYAAMTVLYEVIDTGTSTMSIPALTQPSALSADDARAMVTQFISSKSRSKRLADLLTWIKANLSSFTFPI